MIESTVSALISGLEALGGGALGDLRVTVVFCAGLLAAIAVGRILAAVLGSERGLLALLVGFAVPLVLILLAFGLVEGPLSAKVSLPLVAPWSGVAVAGVLGLLAAYWMVAAVLSIGRFSGLLVTFFALIAGSAAFWMSGKVFDQLARADALAEERQEERKSLE